MVREANKAATMSMSMSMSMSTLLLLTASLAPGLTDLVITIKGDDRHSSRHHQYHFTLLTEKQEVSEKEETERESLHPPLTTYTPPTASAYQPARQTLYYQHTNRYRETKPESRYKPARYQPGRPLYDNPRRKKWRPKRRGPPRKRNAFSKLFF